jgi:hypothetical protein
MSYNIIKQRNALAVFMLVCMALICFLFWRLATIATQNQQSQLAANIDKFSRAQADAQIDSIQASWETRLFEKEGELERFKEMLAKKGQTVALVQTKLIYRDTGRIKTVYQSIIDSTQKEFVFNYPELSAEHHDNWIDIKMTANCDTFTYDLQVRDSILVLFRSEKQRFFRSSKTVAYLYSQSPYTTSNTQAFQSVILPKRRGLFARIFRAIFCNGKD